MSNELRHYAVHGNLERVKQLLEAGVNTEFEEADTSGCTALSLATLNGRYEVVVYLVDNGARATERDHDGKTALHEAAEFGSLEIVQYLLSSDRRAAQAAHH
jgi:ankyrin repeat protein